jgi:hypothetical protein
MRTIGEIRQAFGKAGADVVNGHRDALEAIAAETEPEGGRYLDRLSDEERMRLLREQKAERANESREAAVEAYEEALDRYAGDLSRRTDELKGRLFGVSDAGALSRAALATDTELGALLEIAATARNPELGRAVFVAAEQRDLGDLMARYFDGLDLEARELYAEWSEIPPAETLERQRESVGAILPEPDPDGLMPFARANT